MTIEHLRIAVGIYGKSVILIKKARSYSFSCESYMHLLLSLACIIPLYLYYASTDHHTSFILDKI